MANVYLQDSTLTSIGNAIRSKTGETGLLLPSQMPAAIQSITTGGSGVTPVDIFIGGGSKNLYQATSNSNYIDIAKLGLTAAQVRDLTYMTSPYNSTATGNYIMEGSSIKYTGPSYQCRWQIYPSLASVVKYPKEVLTNIKRDCESSVTELFPAVIAVKQSGSQFYCPHLNAIQGEYDQGIAVAGLCYNGKGILLFVYDYENHKAYPATTTLIPSKTYIYWR